MNGKLARLDDMLAKGWDVEDILSDHGAIEVLLRRRGLRATVVLEREDAVEILYGGTPWGAADNGRATLVVER